MHCVAAAEVAFGRTRRRGAAIAARRAHADPGPADLADFIQSYRAFHRVSIEAPWLEVDTTGDYRPGLAEIVAFINE